MVILFVDMLGVRSKWHAEGREGAETAFKHFRNLIAHSIKGYTKDEVVEGLIETDAAAIICSTVDIALAIGKEMYIGAFRQTKTNHSNRIWIRGTIIPREEDGELRFPQTFKEPLSQVKLMLYSGDLLDAISIEKSGFKGMRLLVDRRLVTQGVTNRWILNIAGFNCVTLKKLRNSIYPKRLSEFVDFLWMATEDEEEMTKDEKIMALRLRVSGTSPEEFLQAAATQVIFHECTAIIGSLRTRRYFQNKKAEQGASHNGGKPPS